MADALADELQTLESERRRLEALLELDQNWRALRELDAQQADGGTAAERGNWAANRDKLIAALGANRIYAARQRLVEAIELLAAHPSSQSNAAGTAGARPADRPTLSQPPDNEVVTLDQPDGSRIKVRVKSKRRPAAADTRREQAASAPEQGNGIEELFGNNDANVSVTVPGNAASAAGTDTLMSRLRKVSEAGPLAKLASEEPAATHRQSAKPAPVSQHRMLPVGKEQPEDTTDALADPIISPRYRGEIEEATVVIIQRDRTRDPAAAKTAPARPIGKARTPATRRSRSSQRKRKPSSRKTTDKGSKST